MSLRLETYFFSYRLNDGGMTGKMKQISKTADSRFTCKVASKLITTHENQITTPELPPSYRPCCFNTE